MQNVLIDLHKKLRWNFDVFINFI